MTAKGASLDISSVKDEAQRPVPTRWRSVIGEIVHAFVCGDYRLAAGVAGVEPVAPQDAQAIERYLQDYGAVLIDLPDETWDTSVCMWRGGDRWEVLVDLWTCAEGRSDLVLHLEMRESASKVTARVHMVHVP